MPLEPSPSRPTLVQKIIWLSDRVLRGDRSWQTSPAVGHKQDAEAALSAPVLNSGDGHAVRARHIDVDVPADILNQLFDRTRQQWIRLGEQEPHWSVLTNDAFKQAELTPHVEEEFYATGRGNADLLEVYETRSRIHLKRGVCLELGCGVGRITGFLAKKFERVIAVDISPGNLALCEARMKAIGVDNVTCVQIKSIDDLAALPEFDVFYSVIALQHNSPPLQQAILKILLPKIRVGGGCLFQVCTNLINYEFHAVPYINASDEYMEVHSIPQFAVLKQIRESGLCIQEVAMDSWISDYGSNTFFATR